MSRTMAVVRAIYRLHLVSHIFSGKIRELLKDTNREFADFFQSIAQKYGLDRDELLTVTMLATYTFFYEKFLVVDRLSYEPQ